MPITPLKFAGAIRKAAVWANAHPKESAVMLTKFTKLDPAVAATMGRAVYATSLEPADNSTGARQRRALRHARQSARRERTDLEAAGEIGAAMTTSRTTNAPPRINYGCAQEFGMMLPSSNTIAEPQIAAMLPPGRVAAHHALRLRSGREALGMLEKLEEAAQLMADAHVDRLIFHCTAVSMHSPEIPARDHRNA